jgi:benzoyl-CoA reductase/2-hydroxyglutaryl-CoA dehydratase subunit BcrC/BadD/HgdB
MAKTYEKMWRELGMDVEKHCKLLSALTVAYSDIYLSQIYRPEGTGYLDFVVSEAHGLRIEELINAKKDGKKIIGSFCLYVPEEIIIALGAIGVGLCGGIDFEPEYVHSFTGSRNICPLIQSFMGFKLSGVCPYFEAADLLVGETTCDGKKKIYERLNELQETYVVNLPPNCSSDTGYEYFKKEMGKLIHKLEDLTGNKLTAENLASGIEKVNQKRKTIEKLYSFRKNKKVPISGKDVLLVSQLAFYEDIDRFNEKIGELNEEIESSGKYIPGSESMKRIMITGTPMALPNWKIHHIAESTDEAVVVCEETCTGTRYFENSFSATGDMDKDLNNVFRHYSSINCACFTPNPERIDDIIRLAKEYSADGVIVNNLLFCTDYALENSIVEKRLNEAGIPALRLETDYSVSDTETIKTRIEAFIETL